MKSRNTSALSLSSCNRPMTFNRQRRVRASSPGRHKDTIGSARSITVSNYGGDYGHIARIVDFPAHFVKICSNYFALTSHISGHRVV